MKKRIKDARDSLGQRSVAQKSEIVRKGKYPSGLSMEAASIEDTNSQVTEHVTK